MRSAETLFNTRSMIRMLLLALETTDFQGSVALLERDRILCERTLAEGQRSATFLAPLIAELLRDRQVDIKSIGLIAVVTGPGSFTGLRVGVTIAKTLAWGLQIPVVGIDTLDILARQTVVAHGPGLLYTLLDAQRQEFFIGTFTRDDSAGDWQRCGENVIVPREPFVASLVAGDMVNGPVLDKLASQLPAGVIAAPSAAWRPRAGTAGDIAWQRYLAGRTDDVWSLLPRYGRPSYAEEKPLLSSARPT